MNRDDDDLDLIDPARSARLYDVGLPGFIAATAIGADGETHLVLAHGDALGDPTVRYDPDTLDALHEQRGPLPLEYVRRVTITSRTHRRHPQ